MNTNRLPTGPEMQAYLKSAGIEAQSVVRRRNSGFYVAEFYNRRMETAVHPAKMFAQAIEDRLDDLIVLDTHDTVADWRPGQPVIWASVTFALGGTH